MISADLNVILPEILLSAFALAGLMAAVYTTKDKIGGMLVWATAAVFVVLAAWIGMTGEGTRVAFNGMFIEDGFARFAKVTILLSAAAVLPKAICAHAGCCGLNTPILVALSVVGMMMMVSAGDLMALYMGLELQSLALYVVASLRRDSVRSTEAGLKYFVLGALSSGLLLYGASLVYGYSGTTLFSGIITTAQAGDMSLGMLFGIVFLISGLAFKVSAVPFHMWTPDRLEPDHCAAFCVVDVPWGGCRDWADQHQTSDGVLVYCPYGVCADGAGGGYGVRRAGDAGLYGNLCDDECRHLCVYLMMQKDGAPVTDIASLNMYAKTNPGRALSMLVLLFSLAGVPPMLGFFGKLYVLRAAYDAGLAWLAIAGVIASVIGAYYYLRIVFYMNEQTEQLDTSNGRILPAFLTVSALIMVLGIINMFGVEAAAVEAAGALVN
ncbi:NADH-quinone oxidoreductase subunit N [Nymphon striatum]|nr:NADH-quinone oxidoreductase subunit N [Nymphon striatum]